MAIEYSKLGDEDNARKTIDKLVIDYNDFPRKAETFWKLGQYYRQDAKMYDQAAELYQYAARTSPKDDDYTMFAQVELVKYYIRTADLAEGDEQYNRLVTEFAENKWLPSNICFIGDTYLRAGEVDVANLLYNQVLTNWPDDPQTIYAKAGLAKVDFYLDLDENANQTIDEILSNYADNPDIANAIYGIGDFCRTLAMFERQKEVSMANPNNSSHRPVKKGEKVKKYYERACSAWERIIQDLPDSDVTPQAYHFAGECYGVLSQSDKMVEYYQKVVDMWPDYKGSSHLQTMIIRYYENLKRDGQITKTQADQILRKGYENLINNYPDWPLTKLAFVWLESHEATEKGDLQ